MTLLARNAVLVVIWGLSFWTLGLSAEAVWAERPGAHREWPVFQNSGSCTIEGVPLAREWSVTKNVAWTASIVGYGQSAPVVSQNQVVVTSTSGPQKDTYHLAAFDLHTGKKRWQRDFENPSPVENNGYVSKAAPTPVADADGYIAYFEGGLVVAVDHQGELRWERNLVEDYGPVEARHGLASSLEQSGDLVFAWVERSEDPYILAIRKIDGKTAWKVAGLGATSWSSPRLIPVADKRQLVCSASGKIAGFDPNSGERLWQFEGIAINTTCTPIPLGDGRFLIGASDGRGESAGPTEGTSNGVVQVVESKDGKGFEANFLWQAEAAKSSFGSPVHGEGVAYFVNRSGVLFGVDLGSGEQKSATRLPTGGIWATPLRQGNLLYVFGHKGTASVVDLAEEKVLAENRLWDAAASAEPDSSGTSEQVLYAAVAVPPYLVIRTGTTLYAIKQDG